MLNTWQLESKTWFAVLLLLGIFNFGFFAMIAYLIAGLRHGSRRPDIGRGGRRSDGLRWLRHIRLAGET